MPDTDRSKMKDGLLTVSKQHESGTSCNDGEKSFDDEDPSPALAIDPGTDFDF
jgi:hypothetical protein